MKLTFLNRGLSMALVVILALAAGLGGVRADDTEVFFPDTFDEDNTASPNVLFLLDTSGSMACAQGVTILNPNICEFDTDPVSRMDRLKLAMVQVLDDLPGDINVGLARFSGAEGGPILFPVSPIDGELSDVIGNRLLIDAFTSGQSGSEAEENLTDGTVAMATNNSPARVRLGTYDPTVTVTHPPVNYPGLSVQAKVSNSRDEAEEWSNNTMETGSTGGGSGNRRCALTTSNINPPSNPAGVFEFFRNPLAYVTSGSSTRDACAPRTAGTPGVQKIGLRFSAVNLPKVGGTVAGETVTAVTITNATLTFKVYGASPSSPTLQAVHFRVRGEAANNSGNFDTGTAAKRVSGRTATTASVLGIIPASANPAAGVSYTLPNSSGTGTVPADLSSIISEIHGRSGWATGNAMTLLLEDACPITGAASTCNTNGARRLFQSFLSGGSGSANAPTLTITYDMTAEANISNTTPNKMMTGLRFENVQIPRGANIVHAYLELRARGNQSAGLTPAIGVTVKAEANGDSPTLEQVTSNISARSDTTASVSWTLPTSVNDQDSVLSPDLKDVIEAVTDGAGWCGGNSLTLTLDGTPTAGMANGKRFDAYSNNEFVVIDPTSEAVVKDGPILHLELAADDTALSGATAGCANANVVNQVGSNGDDAEQRVSDGTVTLGGDDLELGFDSGNEQVVAVRFSDVRVPNGVTIQSARLEFTAKNASSGNAGLKIYGYDTASAPPLTSTASSLSSMGVVPAGGVSWNTTDVSADGLTDWANNQVYSANVQPIVSALTDGSWAEGGSMVFLVKADCPAGNAQCSRRAYSREGSTAGAPKLKIKYQGSAIARTVRDELKRLVLDLSASGSTPSVEALWEVARYYRGEGAHYGRTRGNGAGPLTTNATRTNRISHVKSFTTGSGQTTPVRASTCTDFNPGADDCKTEHWENTTTYESPIDNACSSNNIIFFTDGTPNNTDATSRGRINTMRGSSVACTTTAVGTHGECAKELAEFLYTADQSSLENDQTINTYSVLLGFAADSIQDQWLDSVAAAGGGTNYLANDSQQLVAAFSTIISNILNINTTFVAPSVTVNTFNRLTNRDELYFALFKPVPQVRWNGNVKKYKVKSIDGTIKIVDVEEDDAVDGDSGFFANGSQSFWSAAVDGNNVKLGGFASKLTDARNVYTYTGAPKPPSSTVTPFTLTTELLNESNANITREMIGLPAMATPPDPDPERVDILKWARGIDVEDTDSDNDVTDARLEMGDPLHSAPRLVSYRGTNDADTTNDDLTLFVGDNQGALHAIDSDDGTEVFSFTPKELLGQLHSYRNNIGNFRARPYGLDGPITILHKDLNGDLVPLNDNGSLQTGEFVYLYVGMRRGGNNYYSLDVTDRSSPKLRWAIYGGSGKYKELGQTWSEAMPRRIKFNGVKKDVLIFTGGYDPAQDGNSTISNDNQGRAIYIADALTGERLWWASSNVSDLADQPDLVLSNMTYSIPASPTPIDMDNDGLVDRIYFTDVAGQVFRISINEANTSAATLARSGSGRIAVLSGASNTAAVPNTAANARRYFAPPDVALIQAGARQYLTIAIGSGFREKPRGSAIHDRFYVLRDPDSAKTSINTLSIVEGDLYNATANLAQEGATQAIKDQAIADTAAAKGFYITLSNNVAGTETYVGEKVFNRSLTTDNTVIFTSFTPGITSSACQAVPGASKLYSLSIFDGTPKRDLTTTKNPCATTACDRADRSVDLDQQGLPPDLVRIFLSQGDTICVGAECTAGLTAVSAKKVHWLKRSE